LPPPLEKSAVLSDSSGNVHTVSLDAPVTELRGVGPKRAETLGRLGIHSLRDALHHFPRRYEDRRSVEPMGSVEVGRHVTVRGTVTSSRVVRLRGRLSLTRVEIADATGRLTATWFNQPWIKRVMQPGKEGFFTGEIGKYAGLQIKNPEFELLTGTDEDVIHSGRIVPIYPLTERFSQRQLRLLLWSAVEMLESEMPDELPEDMVRRMKFPPFADALRTVHFPDSMESVHSARRRFAFTELLELQLPVIREQRQRAHTRGIVHKIDGTRLAAFRRSLPFELTTAQQRSLGIILDDMTAARPMLRLLQGDVGCGKTVVALHAVCAAVDGGWQTAFMAPTEILAEQHYLTVRDALEPLGINVMLLTGSMTAQAAAAVRADIRAGRTDVAVGTHSLFQSSVEFARLGLTVIDEQQRFGVAQRVRLQQKGAVCDVLTMTATPIPRSLALTVYGATDVTAIDEMPPGRQPVETKYVSKKKRDDMYRFVREHASRKEQVYVVCPRIDDTEKSDLAAATKLFEELNGGLLADVRVGLLHGRLPIDEKDAVMHAFVRGEIDVLVGTTVIEVGIDVPAATVMVVEEAGRFGLAQLHQLRGRVGRGSAKSYCFLVGDLKTDAARKRIEIMRNTNDGFRIAEEDLRLRGPGELAGLRQSGYSNLQIADLARDIRLVETARDEAVRLLETDPDLSEPQHRILRERVEDIPVYGG
jgi:ATP-dependent DNA helicase RecG